MVLPPGSSAPMSVTFEIWRCSRALEENCSDEFSPSLSLCAVTTTVFKANVFGSSLMVRDSMFRLNLKSRVLSV